MSFLDNLKKIIVPKYNKIDKPKKTLADLDFLDTVWILNSDESLLEGWVFDINKKHVIVTVRLSDDEFLDFRFIITRPNTKTFITQNNKVLFLNKPCKSEILSFIQQRKDI